MSKRKILSLLTVLLLGLTTPSSLFAATFMGLGDLPGGTISSAALDVSADGSVVAGYSYQALGNEAFRWDATNGMMGLGVLPNYSFFGSAARGVSADGSAVVGNSYNESGYFEAFRWDAINGMVSLGELPGGSTSNAAKAISADGNVIVGRASQLGGTVLFRWDAMMGMQNIKDLLTGEGVDLTGWYLTDVSGVSADGSTIVGTGTNPNGNSEAWIATLSVPTPVHEPTSLLLLGSGLIGLIGLRRKLN